MNTIIWIAMVPLMLLAIAIAVAPLAWVTVREERIRAAELAPRGSVTDIPAGQADGTEDEDLPVAS
jgi:hypothetical protein